MGSVLAASAAPAPPLLPGVVLPPLPPPPAAGSGSGSGPQREAKNVLPNPGAFEQCHQTCKGNGAPSDPRCAVAGGNMELLLLRGFPDAGERSPTRPEQGAEQTPPGPFELRTARERLTDC